MPNKILVNITNEFCIFELVPIADFSFNWHFLFFGPNLPKKGIISSRKHKKLPNHRMVRIYITLGTKFQLNLVFSFCGPNIPRKGALLKIQKATPTTVFCKFQLVLQISASTDNSVFFFFLDQIYPKRVFWVENLKSVQHRTLNTRICKNIY